VTRIGDIWIPFSPISPNHFNNFFILGVEDLFWTGDWILKVDNSGARSTLISWRKFDDDHSKIQWQMDSTKDQIEELKDQGLDVIIEEETLKQILDLTLQEHHQNVLEGLFSKVDDYVNWIKCVFVEEDVWMQQRLGNNIQPNVHLYQVQVFDDLIEGGNRWTQIKNMIRLDESLNEKQHKQLWDILEEF
jgi:hypothetical protein